MNLNGQIDWSDTDRIVSNDTRYVSLNGDWWRESSSWQTRQNGSPALTRVGLTRTRLTGLGGNTVPSASSPTGAGTGLLTAVAPAEVLPDMSYYISDTMSISSDPCAPYQAWNDFFEFARTANTLDGKSFGLFGKSCCEELADELFNKHNKLFTEAFRHSVRYNLDEYRYGGRIRRREHIN